jgi:parallel beta-helix repeat protein
VNPRRRAGGQLAAAVTAVLVAGGALPAGVAASPASVGSGRVILVDDDRMQCRDADFTSVQDALDEASDGDRVRVCAGVYREALTIDESITLQGNVGPVAAVDCLDPAPSALDDLDVTRFTIVQQPDTPGFDGALVRIAADDVSVMGLVLQGRLDTIVDHPTPTISLYDAAVSVAAQWSGTRLAHNLFRRNTLGVELGNSASQSRVDHNCFRDNSYAVANQRYVLVNARIDNNTTFRTDTITFEIGWTEAGTADVTVDHNVADDDNFYVVYVDHSVRARVVANTILASGQGIRVNPQNDGVQVVGNTVKGDGPRRGLAGVFVTSPGTRPATTGLLIADNQLSTMDAFNPATGAPVGRGISLSTGAQPRGAVITGNRVSATNADGIVLFEGNHGSTLAGNTVTHSLVNGIRINLGARENVLTGNTALDNATDVRDLDLATNGPGPTSNQWIRTTCRTSVPAGLCVSTATDGSVG